MSAPRRTPLYDRHLAAGAKMVEFAGWEMPVQYEGLMAEHRAVRQAAGLFDVSHMGEFRVTGPDAVACIQALTPNDVAKLAPGRIHYSAFLTEQGTYVDDLLVYRIGANELMIVVNAANAAGDFAWATGHARGDAKIEDVSDDYALIALQGPKAVEILRPLTGVDLSAIRYYGFAKGEVSGRGAIVSRTGYTGEDGFELYVAPDDAAAIWDALLDAGRPDGLVPAGLGARDTLRLEAAMALYGHELDRTVTPWQAGLDWTVKLDQGDFLGRGALVAQRASGIGRKLIGFVVEGRGIARQGHTLHQGDRQVGVVSSGTFSPTFEKALGLAYVEEPLAAPGTAVEIDVRGKRIPARLASIPFYKRSK
jgi:aminomethyltransferase